MQLMVALKPIHQEAGIERLIVSTYQSVSGTGQKALTALDDEARAALEGGVMPSPQIYPEPIAFNVIGAAGNFVDDDDHTDEERKMMFETHKILEDESIGIAVTCVRVPVHTGHSEAVNIQTREPLSAERAVELLTAAPRPDPRKRADPRCAVRVEMRSSSAVSVATTRTRVVSGCLSSPTISARVQPPTRSRSQRF